MDSSLKMYSAELAEILIDYDLNLPELPTSYIPSPESETLDISTQPLLNRFPYCPRGPPERTTFTGDYNFNVEINSNDIQKRTFLYSHRCNCIYVDINCNFSVQFNWDYFKAPHVRYVRSTVVFSDETQCEKRVERCVQHFHESTDAGVIKEIAKNVLRSSREIGTQGVHYCGNVDLADSWYSVLVEFVRTSPDPCSHAFQFACKNSCSTGINRRAIAIIFTLEDQYGRVFGRQKVGARVCACPRRDMHKEETALGVYHSGKKRVPSNQIQPAKQPKTKKIKLEAGEFDATVHTLPPLQVMGSRAMVSGLRVMQEMMEQAADCRKNDPDAVAVYQKHINEFKEAIQKLESAKTPPE